MIKYFSAVVIAIAVVLSGCSSSGSDDPPSGTAGTSATGTGTTGGATGTGTTGGATGTGTTGGATGTGTTGTGTTGTGTTGGAPIAPSGDIVGAWYGSNDFGEGVMIVDVSGNITAFAANGSGLYQTVFGPSSGGLQSYTHRNSDNTAFDEITLVGDAAPDPITYSLTATSEGRAINNSGGAGDFSMTFATEAELTPISVADIVGAWTVTTSFCPADCDLTVEMTFAPDGGVSGFTRINADPELTLAGTVSAADSATQYLNVEFIWAEKRRSGVVYFDRRDTTQLFLNTSGPGDEGKPPESFTASLSRR